MNKQMKRVSIAAAALLMTVVAAAALLYQNSTATTAPAEHSESEHAAHAALLPLAAAATQSGPTLTIALPERFRVLTNQLFDLRVEAEGLTNQDASLRVLVDSVDVTNTLPAPQITINNDLDQSLDRAWSFRQVRFTTPGVKRVEVVISDNERRQTQTTLIGVQDFSGLRAGQKSIILYVGDAMGTAYRDAGRIVAKSTANRFREGFFDELQQMDQMPATGMVMTYALENITPDSANTGTAWASGNKTVNGALNVFPDNTDERINPANLIGTRQFALDNPRVETLWEYMKRVYGYKTGIVTTSEVTDATPAAQGSHTITRALQNEIARQYVDGSFLGSPRPVFDVIMGGAKERFDQRTTANSGDERNLVKELREQGFEYVENRTQLNALPSGRNAPRRLLGLFRTGNMNVAYDKLLLPRPPDEPAPNFAGFDNQPFLDEMTDKAVDVLSRDNTPFILMVEGASIDKQSHPNYAAGQIWDTIEFDKAVGVGRAFARANRQQERDTLLLVTADHDQSMVIIGAVNTSVAGAVQNVISTLPYPNGSRGGADATIGAANRVGESAGFPDYQDANGDGYPENRNLLRIKVGYRTGDHTGSSVPITGEGPGAFLFTGYYDQTDIFFKMARVFSSNTRPLDRLLDERNRLETINQNYHISR